MIPKRFSIGSKGGEDALGSLHINIASFRIDGWTRSCVAVINDITQEVAETMFPELFSRFSIEADERFLKFRAVPKITHDVNFAVGDHRRGLAGQISGPERLIDSDFLRQIFFGSRSVLVRAAPTEPAAGGSGFDLEGEAEKAEQRS